MLRDRVTFQSFGFLDSVAMSCCAGASCLVPVGWRHMYEMDMEHLVNQNLSVVVVKCYVHHSTIPGHAQCIPNHPIYYWRNCAGGV